MLFRQGTKSARQSASAILAITSLLFIAACRGPGNNPRVDNGSAAALNSPIPSASIQTSERTLSAGSPQVQTKDAPAANARNSQIGSGGNDLFLFTKVRSALESAADLKSANIAIEIKAGVVTLSGTVANAEQKAKAEQLVRETEGIKEVKNRLRIGK